MARKRPYTDLGMSRLPCSRCGARPGWGQWSGCADDNAYRVLCRPCDEELNEMVLAWWGDPDREAKMAAYRAG